MPALLITQFDRLNPGEGSGPVRFLGHVEVDVARLVAQLGGKRLAAGIIDIGNHDTRPFGDKAPRHGGAKARGTAGDKRGLAVQSHPFSP
jgi:hypothetical protein